MWRKSEDFASGIYLYLTLCYFTIGGLGSYRSRYVEEYKFGMDLYSKDDKNEKKKDEKPAEEEAVQVKPAEDEDGNSWSNANSADLLF